MSQTAVVPPRAAFQHRDFRLFQVARLLSIVGTEAQSVAVGWQVYEITGRPLDLGYVGLAQFLPGILLFLVSGHAADRFDRRRVLLICFAGYILCSSLLFTYTLRGQHAKSALAVLPIYAILTLLGIFRAFSGPASQSLLPAVVPEEHFPNAVAWGASVFMLATILGPAVGGLVYAWAKSAVGVYGTAIVMYVGATLAIGLVHTRTGRLEKKNISIETVLAGFRYVWRQKIVLGSISLDLFAVLLGGAVALLPVYAKEILHIGPSGLGLLRSTPAVGAALMGGVLAYRPLRRRSGMVMFTCVSLFGISTIVFGLSRNVVISLIALFVLGASDMVSVIIRGTLVQIATPPEMRGRVSAVNLLFIGASNEFGQFESGITAQWLGAVPAVVFGGIGTLVVVGFWLWLFPELRNVQTLGRQLSSSPEPVIQSHPQEIP